MMIGVVAIHCNVIHMQGYDGPCALTGCIDFFTSKITSIAVPWFFFISAYLTGRLHKEIDLSSYKSIIKRRVRSILLPFILWNTIGYLIREGIYISPLQNFTHVGHNFSSFTDFLYDIYIAPEVEPLWFLRNLFLFSIFYPGFQKITEFNSIAALILFWIIEEYTPAVGTLYFGLGFIAAKHFSPERIDSMLPKFAKFLPILLILMFISYRYFEQLDIINEILVFLGMASIWGCSCLMIRPTGRIARPDIIFFIYSYHGIISTYVRKSLNIIFDFSGYSWLILYLASIILVITICYGSAMILKSVSPSTYAILTGARTKKLSAL